MAGTEQDISGSGSSAAARKAGRCSWRRGELPRLRANYINAAPFQLAAGVAAQQPAMPAIAGGSRQTASCGSPALLRRQQPHPAPMAWLWDNACLGARRGGQHSFHRNQEAAVRPGYPLLQLAGTAAGSCYGQPFDVRRPTRLAWARARAERPNAGNLGSRRQQRSADGAPWPAAAAHCGTLHAT